MKTASASVGPIRERAEPVKRILYIRGRVPEGALDQTAVGIGRQIAEARERRTGLAHEVEAGNPLAELDSASVSEPDGTQIAVVHTLSVDDCLIDPHRYGLATKVWKRLAVLLFSWRLVRLYGHKSLRPLHWVYCMASIVAGALMGMVTLVALTELILKVVEQFGVDPGILGVRPLAFMAVLTFLTAVMPESSKTVKALANDLLSFTALLARRDGADRMAERVRSAIAALRKANHEAGDVVFEVGISILGFSLGAVAATEFFLQPTSSGSSTPIHFASFGHPHDLIDMLFPRFYRGKRISSGLELRWVNYDISSDPLSSTFAQIERNGIGPGETIPSKEWKPEWEDTAPWRQLTRVIEMHCAYFTPSEVTGKTAFDMWIEHSFEGEPSAKA